MVSPRLASIGCSLLPEASHLEGASPTGIRYVTSESIQEYEQVNGPIVDFDRLAQGWVTDRLWFRVHEEARRQSVTDLLRDPIELRPKQSEDLHNIWALGRANRDLAYLRDGTQKGDLRTLLRRLLALTHPVADQITPKGKWVAGALLSLCGGQLACVGIMKKGELAVGCPPSVLHSSVHFNIERVIVLYDCQS
jgi:hypothetical protein